MVLSLVDSGRAGKQTYCPQRHKKEKRPMYRIVAETRFAVTVTEFRFVLLNSGLNVVYAMKNKRSS